MNSAKACPCKGKHNHSILPRGLLPTCSNPIVRDLDRCRCTSADCQRKKSSATLRLLRAHLVLRLQMSWRHRTQQLVAFELLPMMAWSMSLEYCSCRTRPESREPHSGTARALLNWQLCCMSSPAERNELSSLIHCCSGYFMTQSRLARTRCPFREDTYVHR
jgi:hypothetical protein